MGEKFLKKYKWLYLIIAGVAILLLSLVMMIKTDFGNSLVFYLFGGLLITFVVIRFIPLFKTTREKWALVLNAIEMIVDFIVGLSMIILTATSVDKTNLFTYFPLLLGGVFYLRGLIYLIEIVFLNTKSEKIKFLLSIILVTFGTVVIARFDNFNIDFMRYLLIIIFLICALSCLVDGFINYNNYRKNNFIFKKNKEKKMSKNNNIVNENTINIDGDTVEQPQNYVS